jgi:hypothetical protein
MKKVFQSPDRMLIWKLYSSSRETANLTNSFHNDKIWACSYRKMQTITLNNAIYTRLQNLTQFHQLYDYFPKFIFFGKKDLWMF